MSTSTIARIAAAAISAAMLIPLAACDERVPKVATPTASASASPVISESQEKKIRGEILKVLNATDQSKDVKSLSARVEGPELAVRASQLTIAKATKKNDPHSTIPSKISQTVIPTDSSWPRSVFTITTTTDDQQSQRLLVLNQDSARSNYKLWGVARLFQGAQLPAFEIPKIGSSMGTLKDTGLVATPADAVAHYADLLQNGSSSKYASQFEDDQLRKDLATLTATVQKGIADNKGTQSQTFTPQSDQIKVMRAANGGDLVVAQINSAWTRSAGEGRESLPASDAEKALFGNGKATSTMKVTYVNVIALYIPTKASNGKIQAVGAERQPIKVEAQ
ncbi:hypothetical protein [Bifidobacterium simiarum]|uniref:DUF8094 domain-containing protein n=1 Tax=Bifidobacterium simiarum TaxID=2045441 RepID=A0A2M9HDM5_9BIFI|nr:hypothetical protein [Bifidobacterium simiarum]MBT1167133.1 hypothetical protein [Bifidobacterium simiarum]PJM74891.1 hypothetical protein CSQ87_08080 [Bifidobacterium simiarum]